MSVQSSVKTPRKFQYATLPVYNLSCGGGGALTIERVLSHSSGVMQVYVNPATEMAYIEYDPLQSDPDKLATAIECAGFGPKISKIPGEMTRPTEWTPPLDPLRLALVAGLCLAGVFAIFVIVDLLFPSLFQSSRIWGHLLIGFDLDNGWTLFLGLAEVFIYGAVIAWGFGGLYNALRTRTRLK